MHVARLQSTVALVMPCRFSHAGGLGASHAQVTPVELAQLSHKRSLTLLSFFILSSVVVAPLTILEFHAPYEAYGYLCRLYQLIWMYFEFFCLD
jgi:hypothetical protein